MARSIYLLRVHEMLKWKKKKEFTELELLPAYN